jgi:hypothetical protein
MKKSDIEENRGNIPDCVTHSFMSTQICIVNNSVSDLNDLQLAAKALEVVEELYQFIQPLSADLVVVYRDDKYWDIITDAEPLIRHWYIESSSAPKNIVLDSMYINPKVDQSSQLSPEVLFHWIETALNQECLNPEYKITWNNIDFNAVRARLFNQQKFQEREWLLVEQSKIPIEKLTDGLWVSESLEAGAVPPIQFSLYQMYRGLKANLNISWSLWTEPENPEQVALQNAISRLLDKGWEMSE